MTDRVSVRRSDELTADLALLAAAGWTTTEAVRFAVRILADAQHEAVTRGVVRPNQQINIVSCGVVPRQTGDVEAK